MADPVSIVRTSRPGSRIIGWRLDEGERSALLSRFPPKYERTIGDHVTLAANVSSATALPDAFEAQVVGWADDQAGLEALVVEIQGSTRRPDGSTYHITWSLQPERRPLESNVVLRKRGWTDLAIPVYIRLLPSLLK